MTYWQIINTAPKDGTRVKLMCPGGEDFGFFDTEWSTERGNGEPLLWASVGHSNEGARPLSRDNLTTKGDVS